MSVKLNLSQLKNKIPANVCLVAVSKTKPIALIAEALSCGQIDFGENYVQELVEKHAVLPKHIQWHFIGHLQSNKVKFIAPFVYLIHGVDSFKLLKEINKEAKKNERVIDCLLQIHIAREETKFGVSFEEAEYILNSKELSELKHIQIKGFMSMASNSDDTKLIANEFKTLQQFATQFPKQTILSYGMSNDFEIAIANGSNLIRVGSLIFGERNYNE